MRPFWISGTSWGQAFGPHGFGVTARTAEEAVEILLREWPQAASWLPDQADRQVVEVRDVAELDQNHVVPNMGLIVRPGIWFPNLNS